MQLGIEYGRTNYNVLISQVIFLKLDHVVALLPQRNPLAQNVTHLADLITEIIMLG
jgi:hypothetical protein